MQTLLASTRREHGIISFDQSRDMKLKLLRTNLRNKIYDQNRQIRKQRQMKQNLSKVLAAHPEHSNILQVRSFPGRPRLEESQPLLLQAITDIAVYGSAAHERRQADI